MLLYHWVMIILGLLSIAGSIVFFAFKVLRYLWRIEQAVESLVEQNKMIMQENKERDEKISKIETRLETVEVINEKSFLTSKRFLAG